MQNTVQFTEFYRKYLWPVHFISSPTIGWLIINFKTLVMAVVLYTDPKIHLHTKFTTVNAFLIWFYKLWNKSKLFFVLINNIFHN